MSVGVSIGGVGAVDAASTAPVVLVLGDSLSAEYGIKRGTGWVALLQERLAHRKVPWGVINASVSGETTSGGASRLLALLQTHHPTIVVIELGGNDALRGLPMTAMRAQLVRMVQLSKTNDARVLVIGMRIPPNYGRAYADEFSNAFGAVAREQHVALVPFLLDGVAEDLGNFQGDDIHPNEASQRKLLDNVWRELEPMLAAAR